MAIMLPGAKAEKQKALQQIRDAGCLLVERIVEVPVEVICTEYVIQDNVISIEALRQKDIVIESYKKKYRVAASIAMLLFISLTLVIGVR